MDHTTGRWSGTVANRAWRACLLVGVVLLLSGCGLLGRDAPEAAPAAPVNTGLLTCTEICAARGQCGARDGRIKVILVNTAAPVVEPGQHDIFFDEGTAVTVTSRWDRQVMLLADDTRQPAQFLQVQPQGLALPRSAWVAEWCFTPDPQAAP